MRELIHQRCNGYCEKCGKPLPESWALHHRKLRSRGGKDDITNLLALCHPCHNLGTDSVHANPHTATQRGFMVASWANPADIPVILPSGIPVLLTDDGGYIYRTDGQ